MKPCNFSRWGIWVVRIHMVGDDLVWSIYTADGVQNFEASDSISENYIPNIYGKSSELIELLDTFKGVKVKEIYLLYNSSKGLSDNMIRRKHDDGEYTLTVY